LSIVPGRGNRKMTSLAELTISAAEPGEPLNRADLLAHRNELCKQLAAQLGPNFAVTLRKNTLHIGYRGSLSKREHRKLCFGVLRVVEDGGLGTGASAKRSLPQMSRELAGKRSVGDSESSSFDTTSFVASIKQLKADFIKLQRQYEKLAANYMRLVARLDCIEKGNALCKLSPGLPRKELLELHKRVLARVRKMTPEEGFRSLVESGIYTPAGKLAKEYGGP